MGEGECGPSRCLWRTTLSSLNGASAAAEKAALRLVANEGDAVDETKSGALADLSPEELSGALLSIIKDELENDKAEDVVTIPLAGKSDIADHMIVASGRSARHVSAMADKIVRRLKDSGFGRAQVEGAGAADWVLIDAGDIIVHLFRPEVRQFYNLERVWSEAAHAPVKADA